WEGDFDEVALRSWAENLRKQLAPQPVSLGLVFMSPRFFSNAAQVLEILRVHAQIPLLAGCSSAGVIAGNDEIEDNAGLALAIYSLPGAELKGVRFTQEDLDAAEDKNYWPKHLGVKPESCNGWLAFVDPFNIDADTWLSSWNAAYPTLP